MDWWQEGYNKGHEDGLQDNLSMVDNFHDLMGMFIDTALGVTDEEEIWRNGYQEGYEAGQAEREQNQEN